MIKINDVILNNEYFAAGEIKFDTMKLDYNDEKFNIKWHYESDLELIKLYFLVSHIRSINPNCEISLYMPYIPHARMDRVKTEDDVFTLKYFANILNSLNINKITTLDAHSDVSLSLINNIYNYTPDSFIYIVLQNILDKNDCKKEDIVIFFPDYGAYKRYFELSCFNGYKKIYGEKIRNWETHRIEGLNIINNSNVDLKNKIILMVDDIISYGGTLYHSALKLSEYPINKIYSFTTHTENVLTDESKGTYIKLLNNGVVDKHFTTGSIYKKDNKHKSIVVC